MTDSIQKLQKLLDATTPENFASYTEGDLHYVRETLREGIADLRFLEGCWNDLELLKQRIYTLGCKELRK